MNNISTTHNSPLNLQARQVRLVRPDEAERYQALMQAHHYLGSLAKIGENLRYVAAILDEWVALLSFSSAALKCAVRDRRIGWNFRHRIRSAETRCSLYTAEITPPFSTRLRPLRLALYNAESANLISREEISLSIGNEAAESRK